MKWAMTSSRSDDDGAASGVIGGVAWSDTSVGPRVSGGVLKGGDGRDVGDFCCSDMVQRTGSERRCERQVQTSNIENTSIVEND